MELILLEKIGHLGNLGDQVKVKAGYGRNYLIPQGKAIPASKANVAVFAEKKAEFQKKEQELTAQAKQRAEKLDGVELTVAAQVIEEGALYGSVGIHEITDAATQKGHEIDKSEIDMPEGPIKQIGDYEVAVHLHGDVTATLKIKVIPAE